MKIIKSIIFLCFFLISCFHLSSEENHITSVRKAVEVRDSEKLSNLLKPYKQIEPVYDNLVDTEIGNIYYSIGSYLEELYYSKKWNDIIFMLENGASGFIENGQDPLILSFLTEAIISNNTELLIELINAGALFNVENELGNIIPDVITAVKYKSYDSLRTLLDYGYDPNFKYKIHFWGEPGWVESTIIFDVLDDEKATKMLIDSGANINAIQTQLLENNTFVYEKIILRDNKYQIVEFER